MKKIVVILCIVLVLCILLLVMPSAAVKANVTATVSSSIVAHGDKIFINGSADGQPPSVAIWILGKNFAQRQTLAVNVDGSFSYEINQALTKSMESGQYFVVVQHPMMNGVYDIDICPTNPVGSIYVCDYAVGQPYGGPSGITGPVSVFKLSGPGSLQGSDAAEALVTAIYQPNIDDTCTKLQFQIVSSSKIGIYKDGTWYLDTNGNGVWDGASTDRYVTAFGLPGWTPVIGDWTGTGTTKIGIYKEGTWYLDMNGNGVWDGASTDRYVTAFGLPGWTPIVGDWNGDTKTEIGIYKEGTWYLDMNGNGVWDGASTDRYVTAFGLPGWTPVIGEWS
jgi:hypothetical protein